MTSLEPSFHNGVIETESKSLDMLRVTSGDEHWW